MHDRFDRYRWRIFDYLPATEMLPHYEKLLSLFLPFGQAPVVWSTTHGLNDPIVIAHFFAYDWPGRENWWVYELCNDPKPPCERYNWFRI